MSYPLSEDRYLYVIHVLMKDDKEERKKQARSNRCVTCHVTALFDLACFFLSSLSSFIKTCITYKYLSSDRDVTSHYTTGIYITAILFPILYYMYIFPVSSPYTYIWYALDYTLTLLHCIFCTYIVHGIVQNTCK